MKKALITFIFITASQLLTAQESCESGAIGPIELNTINKCSTTNGKEENLRTTRQITSKKISSRMRFLKKKLEKNSVESENTENATPKKDS